MAATHQLDQPEEVASKVLRRVQVSKMTRVLQDRLALANIKIQNGWENMSLDAIEPRIEEQLRKKRPASSNDTISDTASTVSSRLHSSSGLDSSPLTAPIFSDDYPRSDTSPSKKRIRPSVGPKYPSSGAVTGRRNRVASARHVSWQRAHGVSQSSPIGNARHARFPSRQVSHLSFVSEGSTIPDDDPPSPEFSEDDDADLPVHSFSLGASTLITSSPPQTPPPDRRMRKAHNVSWSRTPKTGEEGVDLLLHLATSPSPSNGRTAKAAVQAPSTPPCKSTPLPSSHMTPGTSGAGFLGFGPNTPGTNFNFADFVNVTPSPAQGSWSRTPIASRTPATGKDARRRLNFDHLVPPATGSSAPPRSGHEEGLGMELGGELVSSQ